MSEGLSKHFFGNIYRFEVATYGQSTGTIKYLAVKKEILAVNFQLLDIRDIVKHSVVLT